MLLRLVLLLQIGDDLLAEIDVLVQRIETLTALLELEFEVGKLLQHLVDVRFEADLDLLAVGFNLTDLRLDLLEDVQTVCLIVDNFMQLLDAVFLVL